MFGCFCFLFLAEGGPRGWKEESMRRREGEVIYWRRGFGSARHTVHSSAVPYMHTVLLLHTVRWMTLLPLSYIHVHMYVRMDEWLSYHCYILYIYVYITVVRGSFIQLCVSNRTVCIYGDALTSYTCKWLVYMYMYVYGWLLDQTKADNKYHW